MIKVGIIVGIQHGASCTVYDALTTDPKGSLNSNLDRVRINYLFQANLMTTVDLIQLSRRYGRYKRLCGCCQIQTICCPCLFLSKRNFNCLVLLKGFIS